LNPILGVPHSGYCAIFDCGLTRVKLITFSELPPPPHTPPSSLRSFFAFCNSAAFCMHSPMLADPPPKFDYVETFPPLCERRLSTRRCSCSTGRFLFLYFYDCVNTFLGILDVHFTNSRIRSLMETFEVLSLSRPQMITRKPQELF